MADDKNKYILSIHGMSKSFGRNKVLNHIDLNVKPGSIMGLMGIDRGTNYQLRFFPDTDLIPDVPLQLRFRVHPLVQRN